MVLSLTCLIVLFDVCRLCSLLSYFTGTLIVCVDLNFDDFKNFERQQWHINSSNPNTCCKTLTYGTAQINSVDDRFSCLFVFFFFFHKNVLKCCLLKYLPSVLSFNSFVLKFISSYSGVTLLTHI